MPRYTPYQRYCNAVTKAFTTQYPLFEVRTIYRDPQDPHRMMLCSPFVACFVPEDHPIIRDHQDKIQPGRPSVMMYQMEGCLDNALIIGTEDYNRSKNLITLLESMETGEQFKVNSRALKIFEPLDALYGVRHKSGIVTIWDSNPGKNLIHGCIALIR